MINPLKLREKAQQAIKESALIIARHSYDETKKKSYSDDFYKLPKDKQWEMKLEFVKMDLLGYIDHLKETADLVDELIKTRK